MKLTLAVPSATQRVLVYGAPKTGKSYLAAKLAEHYNLIWLDCEKGWTTLLQLPKEWQERIELISIPDSRVYPIAAETWPKIVKGGNVEICEEHGKVSCAICKKDAKVFSSINTSTIGRDTVVVFDSLTQLTNSIIAHITKGQPDDYKMQLDDWGNLKFLIAKFMSQIQAAGYNVVCITHEEQVQMEDGKVRLVPSSGSSKSSMDTAKYFDHVVYCEVKNKKHSFGSSTDYGMNMVTGSRTGVAMEKSKEPSLLDIFTNWRTHTQGESNANIDITINPAITTNNHNSDGEAISIIERSTGSNNSSSEGIKSEAVNKTNVDTRTPGQIALDNMRAKAQALLNKS